MCTHAGIRVMRERGNLHTCPSQYVAQNCSVCARGDADPIIMIRAGSHLPPIVSNMMFSDCGDVAPGKQHGMVASGNSQLPGRIQ